ncbi:MAG: glycosyltransferase family 2 protein [Planctomycetota bacterium]
MSGPELLPLSVVIIAQDERRNIVDCLRSAAFVSERVVIDGGSKDETVQLCEEEGARVVYRKFDGFIPQREASIAAATQDWVLCLDADERVSPALEQEIRALFANGTPDCDGYELPRLAFHLGRWIRGGGWYPDAKMRLFDRSKARNVGAEPHDRIVVDGAVRRLKGDLLHYPYRDLEHHLKKMDRYTETAARSMFARGRRLATLRMWIMPPLGFLRSYLLRLGMRDGLVGLRLASLDARYEFLRYSKLRKLQKGQEL